MKTDLIYFMGLCPQKYKLAIFSAFFPAGNQEENIENHPGHPQNRWIFSLKNPLKIIEHHQFFHLNFRVTFWGFFNS